MKTLAIRTSYTFVKNIPATPADTYETLSRSGTVTDDIRDNTASHFDQVITCSDEVAAQLESDSDIEIIEITGG